MRGMAALGVAACLPLHGALAAGAIAGEVERQARNPVAIGLFLEFVVATLGISYWASRQTRTSKDFYTAGGEITGLQNGTAIAGDFMSASKRFWGSRSPPCPGSIPMRRPRSSLP